MKSEITVRSQGIKGGDAKFEDKGSATLYLTDRGQKRTDLVIDVDSFRGSGTTYKRREKTLINIDFENTPIFHGTVEELVARLKKPATEFKQTVEFKSRGLVLGNLFMGGEGAYKAKTLKANSKKELIEKAVDMLLDGSLDGGMGFDGLLGAMLEITTVTTFIVNDKCFRNEETESVYIGDLTAEQMQFLEETGMYV
jgi:hypothetical protein